MFWGGTAGRRGALSAALVSASRRFRPALISCLAVPALLALALPVATAGAAHSGPQAQAAATPPATSSVPLGGSSAYGPTLSAGGVFPAAAEAQATSCADLEPFGTLTESPGFVLDYDLFSGGGQSRYDATFDWGDATSETVTVTPANTQANPATVFHEYTTVGTFEVFLSTRGTLSDGTPCADSKVPIGTVDSRPMFATALFYSAPPASEAKPISSPVIPRSTMTLTIQIALTGATGTALDSTPAVALNEPKELSEKQVRNLLALKQAFEICYLFGPFSEEDFDEAYSDSPPRAFDDFDRDFLYDQRESFRARFEACVGALVLLLLHSPPQAGLASPSGMGHAAAAGCRGRPLPIILRAKRGARRAKLTVGSPKQARSRLKVRCSKTGKGAIRITIRPRKRSTRLRAVLGRRLKLGVGRTQSGPDAQEGDRLRVRWSKSGR